jgi:hypothetical protein
VPAHTGSHPTQRAHMHIEGGNRKRYGGYRADAALFTFPRIRRDILQFL